MFESDYKRMMDGIAPSLELISDTLAKAQAAGQGRRPVRRVRGSLVLAAILLLGIISASAITLRFTRVFDMNGADVTEAYLFEMDQSALSATPSPAQELAHSLLGKAPANEYWSIWYGGNTMTSNRPRETITSLDAFKKRIAASCSRFLIPQDIPAGYMLQSAEIEFYLKEKDIAEGLVYLGTEVMPAGVRIYKYRVPDSVKDNISRYFLLYKTVRDEYLTISCEFGQFSDEHTFYVSDGTMGEAVTLKSMLEGVFLKGMSAYDNSLYLRTMYLPNEKMISWPDYPPPKQPGNDKADSIILKQPIDGWPYSVCDAMYFSITSTALDKDQLIKIAESLK